MEANNAISPTSATFDMLRSVSIEALNLRVEEYQHRATGATHLHLASDNPENVFMVALRTVPQDSTGVAHILEHTVLCGSENFPVRDPFFMMLRRSLNTWIWLIVIDCVSSCVMRVTLLRRVKLAVMMG